MEELDFHPTLGLIPAICLSHKQRNVVLVLLLLVVAVVILVL